MQPSAATSATAEPEISAKNTEVPMSTIARPPRMKPSSEEAKAIRRADAGGVHDRARQDEQRYGDQREALGPVVQGHGSREQALHAGSATMATAAITPNATAIGTLIRTRTTRPEHQQHGHAGLSSCSCAAIPASASRQRSER